MGREQRVEGQWGQIRSSIEIDEEGRGREGSCGHTGIGKRERERDW